MAKVLVVEDDPGIQNAVGDWLESQFHTVEVAENGFDALEFLKTYEFEVVVLDLNLPDIDGLKVLKEYRARGGVARVLILSARSEIVDREIGLDQGADDYLIKPFHPRELSARLRALLRRPAVEASPVITVGSLALDVATFSLTRNGQPIKLQPKEFALLEFFMRHPDRVFSADAILEKVWKADSDISSDTLRVHIKRLRDKLDIEGLPSPIQTLKGVGYRLDSHS